MVFTSKNNSYIKITVKLDPSGRIEEIEKSGRSIRFPFSIGQLMTRNIETWACNNNMLIDGQDPCPEEKVFGIRKKDIPHGHPLRMMYPSKFKN